MASLTKSKTIFGFTSPRTLEKIIPEVSLLNQNFSGQKWSGNNDVQAEFFDCLFNSEFYEGDTYPNDPALAARDRITRAPKSLGFIDLEPIINITPAGNLLLTGKRIDETFTRQLLKFQLPSPYHTQSKHKEFHVKPYLELIRLIYDLKSLSKTEVAIFFLQMTDYRMYDSIKTKIEEFRKNRKGFQGSPKTYAYEIFKQEVLSIYEDEVKSKNLKTRQSNDESLNKFIKTKMSNLKDYSDAFFRYLRSTGLVTFEKNTLRLTITPSKKDEVEFLLNNVQREPEKFATKEAFKDYLFDPYSVRLLTDDISLIINKLTSMGVTGVHADMDIEHLKDILEQKQEQIKSKNILNKRISLKSKQEYKDIIDIFDRIKSKDIPDAPLFLEWNVWRSFVMLNHANRIDGNFIMDMEGMPLNTAPGGKADLEIEFDDFGIIGEVTLSGGHTQFKMEGDSVPRHYGEFKKAISKETYCIFIAPKISEGSRAHFYNLNRFETKLYGGKTKIIPLTLDRFVEFVKIGVDCNFSNPLILKNWLETQWECINNVEDEEQWFFHIENSVTGWACSVNPS